MRFLLQHPFRTMQTIYCPSPPGPQQDVALPRQHIQDYLLASCLDSSEEPRRADINCPTSRLLDCLAVYP